MKMCGIRGEILRDAQGAPELHDRHQMVWPGGGVDKFRGRAAGLNLVRCIHGGVVEEQNQVAALAVGLLGRVGAGGKTDDRLLFVILEDLKVLLRQIADVVPFFVRNHRID